MIATSMGFGMFNIGQKLRPHFKATARAAPDIASEAAPQNSIALSPPLVPDQPRQFMRVIRLQHFDAAALSACDLTVDGGAPRLTVAYVSPHLDFRAVVGQIKAALPAATKLIAVSTAGELSSAGAPDGTALYCKADGSWSSVVLQLLSPDLIEDVSLHTVPLHCEDIRAGGAVMPMQQRLDRLRDELAHVKPSFRIDPKRCLALTFIDGVSASESFLMEAVYAVSRFRCLFVGGSAGGKLDFKNTWIFDGTSVRENVAVIAFLHMAPDKRFGIFKTHNFRKTNKHLLVCGADAIHRTVSYVSGTDDLNRRTIVEALAEHFACAPEDLAERMKNHTFGVEIEGEIFVRSVASIDLAKGSIAFYCDIAAGDELYLLEPVDFIDKTDKDFAAFLERQAETHRHDPQRLRAAAAVQSQRADALADLLANSRGGLFHLRRTARHQHQPDLMRGRVLRRARGKHLLRQLQR